MPRKKAAKHKKTIRATAACSYEIALRSLGFTCVCGVDEAGRGPLAGPVVAAAVVLNPGSDIRGINDSKKLTAAKRAALFEQIVQTATGWRIAEIHAPEIDRINILQASLLAMRKAVEGLPGAAPDFLLVDGRNTTALSCPQRAIVKGDSNSVSIAAASILAKVHRDRLMEQYDEEYPGYGFARHKGYGTAEHVKNLEKLGPCVLHRRSFEPVRRLLGTDPVQGGFF